MMLLKIYLALFVSTFISILPIKSVSYSEEISKLECGIKCHTKQNSIHIKEKFHSSECSQCHNSGDFAIYRLAESKKDNIPAVKKKKRTHSNKYMALIPAGEFIMGSNKRRDDEKPEFTAKTDAYYIDIFEVTNLKYKEFVNSIKHPPPAHWDDNQIPKGLEEHPVTYVSWKDAADYCEWAGKRLPTEAEWEKAARGKSSYAFPWGNELDILKYNSPQGGSKGTKPVGSYKEGKSTYGLYDMAGNVWEWTSNWYLPHPGNKKTNRKYGKINRVAKGGSWFDCIAYGCGVSAPSFNRGPFIPRTKNNTIGFRCAKDASNH